MLEEKKTASTARERIDPSVLRHMLHETIDLLDASADHTVEACESTDAAMALTRIDWMLMGIFGWLTRRMQSEDIAGTDSPLGEPVSVVGIAQETLSEDLRLYARKVDRLHMRVRQLESLTEIPVHVGAAATENRSGQVLHIFGDPKPEGTPRNPVLLSRQRLRTALASA